LATISSITDCTEFKWSLCHAKSTTVDVGGLRGNCKCRWHTVSRSTVVHCTLSSVYIQ